MTRVAFIGLGAMGWPMAARLVEAGFDVAVFDADSARTDAFCNEYAARPASDPGDAASHADIALTMLPTSSIVESVLFASSGIAAALSSGAVLLEMSSGNPTQTAEFAERLSQRGVRTVDAPVSGGVSRAKSGELAIMAGGADSAIELVEPVLAALGTSVTRTGPVGSGQAMKALNNLTSATGLASAIEVVLIGKAWGLDPALMVDILNASTGMSNSTLNKLKQFVLSESFDSGFGLDLAVKDIATALSLAGSVGVDAELSELTGRIFAAAQQLVGPGGDHTEVAKYLIHRAAKPQV